MTTPSHVEVLHPVDRWLHLGGALGGLGALVTGPLVAFPGFAARVGLGMGVTGPLHGACAALAVAAWVLHLTRVCMSWLDGGSPWGLVPRTADLREVCRVLLGELSRGGARDSRCRYSYRERIPYGAFQAALPVLCATGWISSHPGLSVAMLGAAGLVGVSAVHAAAGLLTVPFVLWHVYFTHLQPAALYWNGAWLTGKVPWARVEAMWPGWAREIAAEALPAPAEEEPEAPSVQSLLEEGNRAAREGRYADAEAAYETALRLYPGYSQALYNLAVARARASKTQAAVEALERFLEQDPFSPVAPRARELLTQLQGGADG